VRRERRLFFAENMRDRVVASDLLRGGARGSSRSKELPEDTMIDSRIRRLSKRAFALPFASLATLGVLTAACGGAPAKGADSPQTENSGQSKLMEKSFAGNNKCNPKNHNRPFIIEWDATDMSQFQSFANNDVVFVKYEGCDLQVLEGCRDDSVKGSFGSYAPVSWTSGSVETIDVADQTELYAKLPLGAASLAPRVESGEKFHMEYYVSGTRNATRDKIYKSDLSKNASCAEATHFVYGYNLGAFALASASKMKGELGGTYFGIGAGASKARTEAADKKGGDLSSCKGESAKETETCKVPIRLTLRAITEGDNPDQSAATAPETDAAKNLAGKLQASTQREKDAAAHLQTATIKMNAKDGKSCIAELDQHDRLDPRPLGLSTNPQSGYPAVIRAQCLMASGKCAPGKELFRKQAQAGWGATQPDKIDVMTDAIAGQWCQGGAMSPRDQFVKARMGLQEGMTGHHTVQQCTDDYQTMMRLKDTVKPKDEDDVMVKDPVITMSAYAPACFARAGDCNAAFNAYEETTMLRAKDAGRTLAKGDPSTRRAFEMTVQRCKTK
jgi:hypothetical protein